MHICTRSRPLHSFHPLNLPFGNIECVARLTGGFKKCVWQMSLWNWDFSLLCTTHTCVEDERPWHPSSLFSAVKLDTDSVSLRLRCYSEGGCGLHFLALEGSSICFHKVSMRVFFSHALSAILAQPSHICWPPGILKGSWWAIYNLNTNKKAKIY